MPGGIINRFNVEEKNRSKLLRFGNNLKLIFNSDHDENFGFDSIFNAEK
jgi:hypothetical protein